MEKPTKLNTIKYLIWTLVQMISGIALVVALAIAMERFKGEISPYLPGVWMLFGFMIAIAGFTIGGSIRALIRARSGIDNTMGQVKRPIGIYGWSLWHALLGIIFTAGSLTAVILLWEEIQGNYENVAIFVGVALIGYGLSLLISAGRILFQKMPKGTTEGTRHMKKMLPGMAAFGLIFFLILPAGGLYYLFGFILPAQAWAKPMNRGPILFWFGESNTSSSIVVAWDSVDQKDYELQWGEISGNLDQSATPHYYPIYAPTDDGDSVADGDQIGYRYYYEITGLKENTKYYYQIPGFSDEFYFNTAPNSADQFSFQLLGDNRNSNGIHRSLVKLMNSYEGEFVINAGDICNDDVFAEWNEFFDDISVQANTRPYMIGIGNHESGSHNIFGHYFNYVGENVNNTWIPERNYYALNYSNMHLLVLDTNLMNSAQLQFAAEDLERNAGKHTWTVVAMHAPIFSTGGHNYQERLDDALMGNFTKWGVDVVLTGHDHHYESFNISKQLLESQYGLPYANGGEGMIHIVSGGGGVGLRYSQIDRELDPWGAPTQNASEGRVGQRYFPIDADENTFRWRVSDIMVYAEVNYQFVQVDVNSDAMLITSIRLDGSTIETFNLQK